MSYLIDKEIAIMSVLDHAHIVHLNEVYDEDDTVCFVIELAKGTIIITFHEWSGL